MLQVVKVDFFKDYLFILTFNSKIAEIYWGTDSDFQTKFNINSDAYNDIFIKNKRIETIFAIKNYKNLSLIAIDLLLSKDLIINLTDLQLKIMQEICKISIAHTKTYSEISQDIGLKNGARIVARTCSTNKFPVLFPCHRVVTKDKNLQKSMQYIFGADKKMAILDFEKKLL